MININTKIFAHFAEIQYIYDIIINWNIIKNILNFMQRFPDKHPVSVSLTLRNKGNNPVSSASIAVVRNNAGMSRNLFSSVNTAIIHRQSLRSGTVMEHGRLSFRTG